MGEAETKKPSFFVRDATGLTRQLSAKDIIMFNILFMGIPQGMVYLYFAASVYQGVNLPLTVIISAPLVFVMAMTCYLMAVAFPRTGGRLRLGKQIDSSSDRFYERLRTRSNPAFFCWAGESVRNRVRAQHNFR